MANKLHKRSDGAYETPDGYFAIRMLAVSGTDGEMNWFEYHGQVTSPLVRVEWPANTPFALMPQASAVALVRLGYARTIIDALMNEYNAAVDAEAGLKPHVADVTQPVPVATKLPAFTEPPAPPVVPAKPLATAGAPEGTEAPPSPPEGTPAGEAGTETPPPPPPRSLPGLKLPGM